MDIPLPPAYEAPVLITNAKEFEEVLPAYGVEDHLGDITARGYIAGLGLRRPGIDEEIDPRLASDILCTIAKKNRIDILRLYQEVGLPTDPEILKNALGIALQQAYIPLAEELIGMNKEVLNCDFTPDDADEILVEGRHSIYLHGNLNCNLLQLFIIGGNYNAWKSLSMLLGYQELREKINQPGAGGNTLHTI